MLPPEIEPFADHHIEKLGEVRETLRIVLMSFTNPVVGTNAEEFEEAMRKVADAQHALTRFKVCMVDEVKQKEQFRIKARDCRLHHK